MFICFANVSAIRCPWPEDARLGIGRPVAALSQTTPHKPHLHHHPTDCTQASGIPPGRASGERLLSSHQRTRKTIQTCLGIPICERRWYIVGHSERNSHEQNMSSKGLTRILRSEPNCHDSDGACPWNSVVEKVMNSSRTSVCDQPQKRGWSSF